jgi:hypothetical protein
MEHAESNMIIQTGLNLNQQAVRVMDRCFWLEKEIRRPLERM